MVIAARRTERLSALKDDIEASGGVVHAVALDVNQFDKIDDFYQALNAAGFMPDILVNNAGMNVTKNALELTPDEYQTIV